jgi:hypothetical protein
VRLCTHPSLDVHTALPPANKTAFEISRPLNSGYQDLAARVRRRISELPVADWTVDDVANWMTLSGHRLLKDAFRRGREYYRSCLYYTDCFSSPTSCQEDVFSIQLLMSFKTGPSYICVVAQSPL